MTNSKKCLLTDCFANKNEHCKLLRTMYNDDVACKFYSVDKDGLMWESTDVKVCEYANNRIEQIKDTMQIKRGIIKLIKDDIKEDERKYREAKRELEKALKSIEKKAKTHEIDRN